MLRDVHGLTTEELSNLLFIKKLKAGSLFQNKSGTAFYFKDQKSNLAHIYKRELLEFIEEWGALNLSPSPSIKKTFDGIRTVVENVYPAYCRFKDGVESEYCLIQVVAMPPPASYFEAGKKWYYLNQVAEMRISQKAVSNEIISCMKKMQHKRDAVIRKLFAVKGNLLDHPNVHSSNTDVVVKHKDGRYFKWDDFETFIFLDDVNVSDLELVGSPTPSEIENATLLSEDRTYYERREYKESPRIIRVFCDAL